MDSCTVTCLVVLALFVVFVTWIGDLQFESLYKRVGDLQKRVTELEKPKFTGILSHPDDREAIYEELSK